MVGVGDGVEVGVGVGISVGIEVGVEVEVGGAGVNVGVRVDVEVGLRVGDCSDTTPASVSGVAGATPQPDSKNSTTSIPSFRYDI